MQSSSDASGKSASLLLGVDPFHDPLDDGIGVGERLDGMVRVRLARRIQDDEAHRLIVETNEVTRETARHYRVSIRRSEVYYVRQMRIARCRP